MTDEFKMIAGLCLAQLGPMILEGTSLKKYASPEQKARDIQATMDGAARFAVMMATALTKALA